MIRNPVCQVRLSYIARSKRHNRSNLIFLRWLEPNSVDVAENSYCQEGCTLVPVNEWMIASQAESVSRGQLRRADSVLVCMQIAGPLECTFE